MSDSWLSQSKLALSVHPIHRGPLGTSPVDLLSAVSALRLARLSSDWLLRWRAYWRHFPNRRPFLDEAIKRLSNRPLDKHLIRLLILIAPHGKDRGDFEDLALYLLSQIPKTEREWPYIWCRIMLNEPSAEILSVGLEYLGAFEPGVAAKMGGIEYSEAEIGRWIRVWRRLLQHSGERHRAIAMAREREAAWSKSPRFRRDVLEHPEVRILSSLAGLREATRARRSSRARR